MTVQVIASSGWPPWLKTSTRATLECALCGEGHASTWVREAVCLGCELRVRREGRCPFGEAALRKRAAAAAAAAAASASASAGGKGGGTGGGKGGGTGCKCGPRAWCAHDARCLVCDGWSCARCGFHQVSN